MVSGAFAVVLVVGVFGLIIAAVVKVVKSYISGDVLPVSRSKD